MMKKEKVLIVDDQPEILHALERLLKTDYQVLLADNGADGLQILKKEHVAVILADQRMPVMTGVEFLSEAIRQQPDTVRILITAYADLQASISAINKGQIYYYISKPWEPEELQLILRRAVERYRLQRKNQELTQQLLAVNKKLKQENISLKQSIEKTYHFDNIIGNSPEMLRVFKLASKVIDTPTTVLLLGATGTGKEMLAKAIHYNGPRKDKMFVAQNCGALPDSILESELFGHIRGAFTGAVSDKKGLFELADKGTIFLDEIGDTSPALQLNLLRVLQEGEIKLVGSSKSKYVDVRVIAATNKNLEDEVKKGTFREDLYYRLHVFPIQLPLLTERRLDIPDLANHFIDKYAKRINKQINGITEEAMHLISAADFPGNIRQLENEIERAVTLADDGSSLGKELLSVRFHQPAPALPISGRDDATLKEQVEILEMQLIEKALILTNGNILKAARELGLSRAGLHKKLNRYQLHPGKQTASDIPIEK
jgi:two-component system response regulator HupR/HoxA